MMGYDETNIFRYTTLESEIKNNAAMTLQSLKLHVCELDHIQLMFEVAAANFVINFITTKDHRCATFFIFEFSHITKNVRPIVP